MALSPIDTDEDLEAPDADEEPLEDETEPAVPEDAPDPMFAADVSEAFPDIEDAQIMALERAVRGLLGSMGGGGAPPAPPPMGF